MAFKIFDNTKNVGNTVTQRASIFLRNVADDVIRNAEPKTPKREGYLRRSVVKQVLGLNGAVKWNKEYAAKMETKQFRNYTTPGTGPHYAEDAVKKSVGNTRVIAKQSGLL